MKKQLTILLYLSYLLAGCSLFKPHNTKSEVQKVTLDTINVVAKKGKSAYHAKPTKIWEIFNTRIALNFDFPSKTANVKEWINLHPYFYQTDSIELDAKSMEIDSVILAYPHSSNILRYNYTDDILKIYFDKQYTVADSICIYLKYKAMPYANSTGGSRAITEDRGLYFINTDNALPGKPVQIWTQGESEANSHWMITIDKPNTRFTTQIELTVPDTMTTLSNGELIKQEKPGFQLRTDYWRMDMPIQAYVAMFAIGKYSIIKDNWRGKEVNYYVEPEYAPYARAMFKNTPEMMEYFSKRTGVPFPWNKYDQVVARDYVSGAMENTTAALFGEFMNQNFREIADNSKEDVVAHELFHEWFGDYVTCESWSNLTVNESFANYGEQLWRQFKYGKTSADELAYNDLQRYIKTSRYSDPQLVRYNYDSHEEMFDGITYNKGGAILHYINSITGDAAFDKSMKLYLTKNALHSAEAHDWRRALEITTGQDWTPFFNQWYYHPGHPVLSINYNYDGKLQKLIVTVTQSQPDSTFTYRLPLKTALFYDNTKTIISWLIDKKTDTFTYEYKNGIKPLIVPDFDHVLPGEIIENKTTNTLLEQFRQCNDFTSKIIALTTATDSVGDSSTECVIDLALNDTIIPIRRTALTLIRAAQNDEYHKKWLNKIQSLAANDPDNSVRAAAMGLLAVWKDTASKSLMIHSLYDSSYAVAGAALEGIKRIDTTLAYSSAKALLGTNPKAALEAQIWSIIGDKSNNEDIALYQLYTIPMNNSTGKYSFIFSLQAYIKGVQNEASFIKALDIYSASTNGISQKHMKSRLVNFIANYAGEIKDALKNSNNEITQKRFDILKTAFKSFIDKEKDNSLKESFQAKYKATFIE